mgnify:CR=1 FL=1
MVSACAPLRPQLVLGRLGDDDRRVLDVAVAADLFGQTGQLQGDIQLVGRQAGQRDHAANGHGAAAGLAQVEAARADGRWANAYAGSATMEIPQDFLAALQQDPAALAFYATLKRQQLFTIYYRLTSAKRAETRQKRMAEMLSKLGRGESL